MQELGAKLDFVKTNFDNPEKKEENNSAMELLANEIEREENFIENLDCPDCVDNLRGGDFDLKVYDNAKAYFTVLKTHYKSIVDTNRRRIDRKNSEIIEKYDKDAYLALVDNNTNDALEQFATNKTDITKVIEFNGYLVQKSDPIYLDPYDKYFWNAHFYAPRKRVKMLNMYVPTFWANIVVIWLMSITLIITLRFDALKKFLDGLEKLFGRIKFKKSKE